MPVGRRDRVTIADARAFWDREAASFDDAADHGLHDPAVRRAWADLLVGLLPDAPARVVDLGCGTGSLSVLLAEQGHAVTGIDLSAAMIELARAKALAAAVSARFAVGDASAPELDAGRFDVVLARHVLWALPDPPAALRRWCDLLDDDGRLVLVEGRWSTGAGLTAAQTLELVRGCGRGAEAIGLSDARLWGAPIDDERYVVVSPPSGLSR